MRLWHTLMIVVTIIIVIVSQSMSAEHQPNIIVIMSDDLGWDDVSFHGSNLIQTPNIDALAYAGTILHRHYVMPMCTPSRAAYLTGKYPLRFGLQSFVLRGGERAALPLDQKILPQYLKQLGYKTHLVGKWHLGFTTPLDTPCYRGFDSFFGFYNGFLGFYSLDNHEKFDENTTFMGFDVHDCTREAWEARGTYSTDLFTDKIVNIINNHDKNQPVYLQISYNAVHNGNMSVVASGLETPPGSDVNNTFSYMKDPERRMLAGIIESMDKSVGQIIETLHQRDMLGNSVVLFISDNGGETVSNHRSPNWSSNYPLRGVKATLSDGGVRGIAAIWSPLLQQGALSNCLIHITDWLPTLYSAAGGNVNDLGDIDGVDQWSDLQFNLCNQTPYNSKRSKIVINIDPRYKSEAIIADNEWKLTKGGHQLFGCGDYHYGKTEVISNIPEYSVYNVQHSTTASAFVQLTNDLKIFDKDKIENVRKKATIDCGVDLGGSDLINDAPPSCNITKSGGRVGLSDQFYCQHYCLFNIIQDPCEYNNVAQYYPDIVERLTDYLNNTRKNVKFPINDGVLDVNSNPDKHNGSWIPWMNNTGERLVLHYTLIITSIILQITLLI